MDDAPLSLYHASMASRRRLARIAAMQTIFASEARGESFPDALERNIEELGGSQAVDAEYAETLVKGVTDSREAIREAVLKHAPEWPWERMDSITRAILLIGGYELLKATDLPPAVAMNEAIDIAKEFGSSECGKFVNGVLNAIAHRLK